MLLRVCVPVGSLPLFNSPDYASLHPGYGAIGQIDKILGCFVKTKKGFYDTGGSFVYQKGLFIHQLRDGIMDHRVYELLAKALDMEMHPLMAADEFARVVRENGKLFDQYARPLLCNYFFAMSQYYNTRDEAGVSLAGPGLPVKLSLQEIELINRKRRWQRS